MEEREREGATKKIVYSAQGLTVHNAYGHELITMQLRYSYSQKVVGCSIDRNELILLFLILSL